jgi:hypothetical protein
VEGTPVATRARAIAPINQSFIAVFLEGSGL